MTERRKHRLYLDITFNIKMSKREAAKAAQMVLDTVDIARAPVYVSGPEIYVDKLTVIEPKQ